MKKIKAICETVIIAILYTLVSIIYNQVCKNDVPNLANILFVLAAGIRATCVVVG